MLEIIRTKISGCYELQPIIRKDDRGAFIKTYHKEIYQQHGLATEFAEEYYSISKQNVIRGLHFQTPPNQHIKLVYCTYGGVMDVVVDLRMQSPTYGKYQTFEISAKKGNMVYIAEGMAHGFYVRSPQAIMMYKVTTVYAPESDQGIRWDSVEIPWPETNPILSERDKSFVSMQEFQNPF